MAVAVTLNQPDAGSGIDNTQSQFCVYVNLVLTGNYGGASSHGDTVDLSQLGVPCSYIPRFAVVNEEPTAGTAPTGYQLNFCPGTTQANGVLNIMNGAATEYTQASAYSAPLLAAVIIAQIWFDSI